MSTAFFSGLSAEAYTPMVATSAATDAVLSSSEREEIRLAWDAIINHKLLEWGMNRHRFRDDETDPPSEDALNAAIHLAIALRDRKNVIPVPNWVSLRGDGGIHYRWGTAGKNLFTIEIESDGSVIYDQTMGGRIVV